MKLTINDLELNTGLRLAEWSCADLGKKYAAVLPESCNLCRIQTLIHDGDDAYDNYFDSTWFPVASSSLTDSPMYVLHAKVVTVDAALRDDFVQLIKHQWEFIEDNFKSNMPQDLTAALKEDKELQALIKFKEN